MAFTYFFRDIDGINLFEKFFTHGVYPEDSLQQNKHKSYLQVQSTFLNRSQGDTQLFQKVEA